MEAKRFGSRYLNMKERETWVDIAKGISIFLVVLWHAKRDGDTVLFYINQFSEGLIFLRMPLFFFVSGFFIKKSLNLDYKTFFRLKILNIVYLYFLWGNILVFVYNLIRSKTVIIHNPLEVFYNPPPTLWFLFALAIGILFTYLISRIPIKYGLVLMIGMYLVSSHNAEWRNVDFLIRTGRLVPFMYIGMVLFPYLQIFVKKYYKLGFLILIVPLLCYFVMFSTLSKYGLVTLIVSLMAITIMCCFCCFLSKYKCKNLFLKIGENSLYIYVLHRYVIIGITPFLGNLPPFFGFLISAILGIIIPLLVKRYLVKGKINFMFNINYKLQR